MKSRLLLGLGLCLSLFLTSCKDDDVNPADLQVTMQSSNQILVEGGEAVEVTVELDRAHDEIRYLYLDYGANNGEYTTFFESDLRQDSIQLTVRSENKQMLRIPFLAGEQRKVIKLNAPENDLYRGNRPIELKILSYDKGVMQYEAEMKLGFEEKTPKPIFGIPTDESTSTLVVDSRNSTTLLILPVSISGRFQFPQNLNITYSGTAQAGTDFEKVETLTIMPNSSSALITYHLGFLNVYNNRNFDTPKTIKVTLSNAEDGEIAKGQDFTDQTGKNLMLNDTYTLTVKN